MIGLIKSIKRRTPLGWLQLSHEKGRFVVALSGIAFADLLMFMQLGFQNALYDSAARIHNSLHGDVFIFSTQARNLIGMSTFTRRRLYQAMDIPGVESTDAMYFNTVNWKHPETKKETPMLAIGFNPSKLALDIPEVNSQLQKIRLPDTFLFDMGTRGDYKKTIAQVESGKIATTEVERRTIKIDGLFKIGASFGADGSLITSDENFLRMFPRRQASNISLGVVHLKPGYDAQQTATLLQSHLGNDVKVLTKKGFIDFERNYWQTNTSIGFIFSLGVSMGFVVGVIIVYQVLSTDVNAHIKEYATFKAMGYKNGYLLGVIFEQAVIMALLGFLPGLGVSMGLYNLARNATNLPILMTVERAIRVLILTAIMCFISGIIATRKLQSADPADMF
jgi:putative ABC transport system permease protein